MTTAASIVIPTYNKWSRLRFVLEAFAHQPASSFEVVICDDGSTDNTARGVLALDLPYPVRLTTGDHRGAGAARNRAAAEATGDVLIFSDDDMVPTPGLVDRHLAACGDADVLSRGQRWAIPVGEVDAFLARDADSHTLDEVYGAARLTVAEGWTFSSMQRSPLHHYRFLQSCTSNLAVRRSTFEAIGGFSEAFGTGWGAEDTEFGYRAQRADIDLVFTPAAVNVHLEHSHDSGEKFQRGLANYRVFRNLYPGERDVATLFSYLELAIERGHSEDLFDEQTFMDARLSAAPLVAQPMNA